MKNQKTTAHRSGVICVFLSAVLYSIGGLCMKLIPWNGISINAGRNVIALLVIGAYLFFTKHTLRFNRSIAFGAVCVSGTNILFCIANKMTTAANAIVLQFTAPIFVLIFSVLIWHKKAKKADMIACAAVLMGVACFFLDKLDVGSMVGNILALISGVSYAGVFLLNDFPEGDPICSVFWGDVLSVLVGLPFLLQETVFTPTALTSLVILGAFQVGLAYILICIGLRTTPAVTASLISGIEPILNPVLVAVFYGEMIGPMSFVGAVIVLGSVSTYNVWEAKHNTKKDAVS